MSRDIFQQLKDLKSDPNAGWVSDLEQKNSKMKLMEAIGDNSVQKDELINLSFFRWNVTQFISTPVTVAVIGFVLAFSGWMTTVNAASTSLPGDSLYGLKLVTEQIKLKMASLEHKAILHTEFAEVRLEEAVVLQARGDVESAQVVIDAFKVEIAAANSDLQKLQNEGSVEVLAIAAELDDRIGELNLVINEENDLDASQQVATVTKEAGNLVVDVVVDEHEVEVTERSESDLRSMFKDEYNAMNDRKAFDLGRISMIADVIDINDLDLDINARALENKIKDATDEVPNAMNLAARGGYRDAFEILRSADTSLIQVESNLAEVEYQVMQAMTQVRDIEEYNKETSVEEKQEEGQVE